MSSALFIVTWVLSSGSAQLQVDAQAPPSFCALQARLPLLSIDYQGESPLPVDEDWQVVWRGVPISNAQLAELASETDAIETAHAPMKDRAFWVYTGLLTATGGTALSSVGWVLYGQNELEQKVTLPIALGGLLVGLVGVLIMTESIQTSLEPFTAPAPRHRFSREEARRLVVHVNTRMQREFCAGLPALLPPAPPPAPQFAPLEESSAEHVEGL